MVSPEFTENWLVEERVTHHTVPAGPQQHVHMVENFARLARALSSGASSAGSSGGEADHATQALMTQVRARSSAVVAGRRRARRKLRATVLAPHSTRMTCKRVLHAMRQRRHDDAAEVCVASRCPAMPVRTLHAPGGSGRCV